MDDPAQALIEEQIAYYRRRAPEYDATSMPDGDPFAADAARIRAELRAFAPRGRVLELAAGTGQWTGLLAEYADALTAVDASPEMLALNAARVGDRRIRYDVSDIFIYRPDGLFDVVFFAFWLSHLPPQRLEPFWALVASWLAPTGRVFFVDEARHGLWQEEWIGGPGSNLVRRRLADGTAHRVIKVLWLPDELETELRRLRWSISVSGIGPFYWGAGTRLCR